MDLQHIIDVLNLKLLTTPKDFVSLTPNGGYASDLLSCVMAGAKKDNLWVTLQSHVNIVAVAALLEIAAIIITENAQPDESVIAKANSENVTLLSTSSSSFEISGKLWELGIRVG
jgi:hypothetical protein